MGGRLFIKLPKPLKDCAFKIKFNLKNKLKSWLIIKNVFTIDVIQFQE